MRHLIAGTLSCVLLSGCAGYNLTPIAPRAHGSSHDGTEDEGYVFYEPQPHLLGVLKSGERPGEEAYEFELIYLPNYNRPYRFTRYEFLAKNDLKISFADGWRFTGAESSTDSTAALSALVDLAKLTVTAGAATESVSPNQDEMVIFRINTGADARSGNFLEQVYP